MLLKPSTLEHRFVKTSKIPGADRLENSMDLGAEGTFSSRAKKAKKRHHESTPVKQSEVGEASVIKKDKKTAGEEKNKLVIDEKNMEKGEKDAPVPDVEEKKDENVSVEKPLGIGCKIMSI